MGEKYQVYKYSAELNRVVPIEEARQTEWVSAPHVIGDEMPATRHPIDGKFYDSKSKFRSVTRAAGCVEVGNEPLPDRRAAVMAEAKAQAKTERIESMRERFFNLPS